MKKKKLPGGESVTTMPPRPRTIEQRLESIEIMLATLLNKMNATPDNNSTMKEFITQGKAAGLPMVEIVKKWNERQAKH